MVERQQLTVGGGTAISCGGTPFMFVPAEFHHWRRYCFHRIVRLSLWAANRSIRLLGS